METRASYVLVGTFVLGLAAAAVFFVLWLGSTGGTNKVSYHVILTGNVTGLAKGAAVRYRGIQKGEVGEITLREPTPHEIERFKVTGEVIDVEIKVAADTPVYTDTTASLESQGLTGSPFIQLKRNYASDAAKLDPKDKVTAVIQGESAGFEAVLEKLPTALVSITNLANRAAMLLDDENQKKVKNVLDNADKAFKSMDEFAEDAKKWVAKFDKPIERIDDVAKEATEALKNIKKAAGEFGSVMTEARNLLRENRRSISDFTATGLYEFSLFVTDTRKFVRTFDRILTRIEGDPSQFLFGNRQRGFETQGR